MNFEFGSDLHLDFGVEKVAKLDPQTSTLVLAGDVVEVSRLQNSSEQLYYKIRSWFDQINEAYNNVIWVFGNHEYYNGVFPDAIDDTKRWLNQRGLTNIHILDNEVCRVRDVQFFGTTLWTNLRKRNPMIMEQVRNGLNDYRCIKKANGQSIRPEDTVDAHEQAVDKILSFAEKDTTDLKVVVGHHAPSFESIAPQYLRNPLNDAYASDLTDHIQYSDFSVWLHGHIHAPNCYQIGQTVVMANPRGYHGHEATADTFKFQQVEMLQVE